ncbi:unnamed protein product [Pleuronectes platessa]|uniref:Uncharacterized protein n=1 Tax=Pleuronectes platessa TaxID=8262 RepID=A0A9N7YKQ8_PLEPL|nr:unnamed protein product [Pleuronectes platessa]
MKRSRRSVAWDHFELKNDLVHCQHCEAIPEAGGDEEPALSDTDEGSANTGAAARLAKLARSYLSHSQEHRGDTRRPAVKQRELDRAVDGHQPSSRTGICSFVRVGTGGALPEAYKMTSSRLLVCMFLTNFQKQTP